MNAIDQLSPNARSVLLTSALTADDLIDSIDFNDSLNFENVITTSYENGKYVTKIRIENNVVIYKSDLQDKPKLLELIKPSDFIYDSIPLSSFDLITQTKIAIVFMHYYGYVKQLEGEYYFTDSIHNIFGTQFWQDVFNEAKQKTLQYINNEIKIGNLNDKIKEQIQEENLIHLEQVRMVQPSYNCDTIWALSIYFFDKILRNQNQYDTEKNIQDTYTIMDADIGPSRYVKLTDAKHFFVTQLSYYLSSSPDYIFFGGNYHSKFKEFLQMKMSDTTETIITEELETFTNTMNDLYALASNENDIVPFKIESIHYSKSEVGPYENIVLQINIRISTKNVSNVYTLPVLMQV